MQAWQYDAVCMTHVNVSPKDRHREVQVPRCSDNKREGKREWVVGQGGVGVGGEKGGGGLQTPKLLSVQAADTM